MDNSLYIKLRNSVTMKTITFYLPSNNAMNAICPILKIKYE